MFEQTTAEAGVAALTATHVVIAALILTVAVLAGFVVVLRRNMRIKLGPLVIEPVIKQDNGETTGPYPLPGLATDETEPFDLAEIAEAMRASETLRAIEALRAAEAKLALENLAKSRSDAKSSVRSIRMNVCPLCILYEVTGSAPKCHVIPSDIRTIRMGRALEVELRTSQPNVSQHHFQIDVKPQGTTGRWAGYDVRIKDCNSRNGTWVNGKRVEGEAVKLVDGDIIEAASVRYLFYFVLRGDG